MTKKISAVFLTFILILTVFCACSTDQKESTQKSETTSDSPTGTDSKKLDVICTIFPQYDFCREIAGDKINLTLLLDSKTDLHSFEPTS